MRTLIMLCALALVVAVATGIPAKAVASETPGNPIGDPGGSRYNGLFCCCCLLDGGNTANPALVSAPAVPAERGGGKTLRVSHTVLAQWVARVFVLRLI